jgi:pimeloyl-ACP methyl ester carboxylesterase
VPTLYVWGDADDTVGRMGAEATGEFISGPYRFEVLPGGSHYAPDQMPERVSELLLQHVSGYPA